MAFSLTQTFFLIELVSTRTQSKRVGRADISTERLSDLANRSKAENDDSCADDGLKRRVREVTRRKASIGELFNASFQAFDKLHLGFCQGFSAES